MNRTLVVSLLLLAGCESDGERARTAVSVDSGVQPIAQSWLVSDDTSAMDGSPLISMTRLADHLMVLSDGDSIWPSLIIRCKENRTEVLVNNGVSAQPEYGLNDEASVRLRIDGNAPTKETWSESTSGTALFAPQPIEVARRLAGAQRLLFEFTPFSRNPVAVPFTITGIGDQLTKVAATCGWTIVPGPPRPRREYATAPLFGAVWLYPTPSDRKTPVAALSVGEKALVLRRSGEWVLVDFAGVQGWARTVELRIEPGR